MPAGIDNPVMGYVAFYSVKLVGLRSPHTGFYRFTDARSTPLG